MRQSLIIIAGAILLACCLGICLDMVTAHVAVEYFTIHHPRIISSETPWVLALVWGIAASWWFGAIAGTVVAGINSRRPQPLPPARILKWSAIACVVLWLTMIAILVSVLIIAVVAIPPDKRPQDFDYKRRIMAVAMAHQYEYVLSGIALLVIGIMTWRKKT